MEEGTEKKKRVRPPRVRKAPVITTKASKREPWRHLARITPRTQIPKLPYDELPPWEDEIMELSEREVVVMKAYLEMCKLGYRPSLDRLRSAVQMSTGTLIRVFVDLHFKGALHMIDLPQGGWSHLALNPALWKKFDITPPVRPAPAPAIMMNKLHITGRTAYRLMYTWFGHFYYWPDPRDIARILKMSDEGARYWVRYLCDLEVVGSGSYRTKFGRLRGAKQVY